MYVGGLDIGTSGCKIALYDENGNFVKSSYKEYDVKRSSGLHEIDASEIFESVKYVIKKLDEIDIAAIAVTSFGETFTILDESDAVCAPSMLYTDPRGRDECKELSETFGEENLARITGTKPHEMYSIAKILWIKRNIPESFEKARRILLMQDYIVYMLTGNAQIDYSLAARTAAFDIKEKRYIGKILDYCGIDTALLSKPAASGTVAGKIKTKLANELSIGKDTLIVSGCHDQIAALTGAGVFESGEAMDGTGTVECVPVVFDSIPDNPSLYKFGYSVVPHINGKYACYVLSYCGGATLKWFRSNFTTKTYAELDESVTEKPTDILILPHFAGAATPYMDSSCKAAIAGLTFEHTKYDLYKALMEGTAYEIAVNLDILGKYGITPKVLTATGGGARSSVWMQIKADILGVPLSSLDTDEVGAAGTAYLAGRAVGMYEASQRISHVRKIYTPNAENRKRYAELFEKYKRMYPAVKNILS